MEDRKALSCGLLFRFEKRDASDRATSLPIALALPFALELELELELEFDAAEENLAFELEFCDCVFD